MASPFPRAYVRAVEKAEEHLSAADLVASTGNFPLAFAHLVLGLEEWARSMVIEAESHGFFEVGGKGVPGAPTMPPGFLFNHSQKQAFGLLMAALILPIRSRIQAVMTAKAEGKEVDRAQLTARLKADLETSKALADDIDRLELLKEGGLYSGESTRRGTPVLRATETDFRKYREILSTHLSAERHSITHPLSEEFWEKERANARKMVEEFRRATDTGPPDPPE